MNKQTNSSTEHSRSVPKLRFPEFKDEWEKKPLIELSENGFSNGAFNDPKKVGSGYRIINVKDMYVDGTINIDILTRVAIDENEFSKNRVELGDIFFTRSSLVKEGIAHSNVNLSDADDLTFDGHLIRMRPKKEFYSSVFLYYNFGTRNSRIQFIQRGKTTTMTTIGQEDIATVEISFPTLPEQKRIASFFTVLDKKIAELKQKKNLLEQYKKGVMQKLFSQELEDENCLNQDAQDFGINKINEEKNPAILKSSKSRFRQDNGKEFPKWVKKKLGEIGEFQTSSVDKLSIDGEKEVYLVNYMNVYRHENINKETIKNLQVVTAKNSQIISNNLKKGDILFTPSSETPSDIGHSVVIFEDLENCLYSYHLMRFRPTIKIDILYSHYFCNIPVVLNQLSKLATGSTRFTISVKSFSSIIIDLPCIEEQTKIAKFLSGIDEKINRTKNQIQQTQQYKKGLLQKMFV